MMKVLEKKLWCYKDQAKDKLNDDHEIVENEDTAVGKEYVTKRELPKTLCGNRCDQVRDVDYNVLHRITSTSHFNQQN